MIYTFNTKTIEDYSRYFIFPKRGQWLLRAPIVRSISNVLGQ
ncbi:hypothetical protein C4K04_3822 [Pseudomonas chlororaphis]|uniref:Uncharacterized protein n=1 Tax=Pseudomonas chlororaphis TaxID=587753 RepID=A0A3G7TSS2_9PSED|nr:hypothetical protein C4K04_3822 [Pseudomonas chlororaphis]